MSSWVDITIINSVMAGLLLVVAGLWAWYAFTRVHQLWLHDQVGAALDAAEGLGLRVLPTGFRARLVATGDIAGRPVRVEWRTGMLGPRTVVRVAGARRRVELIRSAEQLRAALAG